MKLKKYKKKLQQKIKDDKKKKNKDKVVNFINKCVMIIQDLFL